MKIKGFHWYDVAIVFIVTGIAMLSMLTLASAILIDDKKDTTAISNIGFVALVALSTVCFNWARTFDDKDEEQAKIIKRLYRSGSRSVFASLCFITASMSKYVYREFDIVGQRYLVGGSFTKFVFGISYMGLFMMAFFLAYYVVARLSFTYLQAKDIFKD